MNEYKNDLILCPKCGAQNNLNTATCINCGTSLQQQLGYQNNVQNFVQKSQKKNVKLIIGIIVAILVFVVMFLIYKMYINKNQNGLSPQDNKINSSSKNLYEWQLVINGNSIVLPIKYSDFINLGFTIDKSTLAENINYHKIMPKYSFGTNNTKYNTTYTNGDINGVALIVYNPSDEEILIKDSIVIGIEFTEIYDNTNGNIKFINKTRNTEVVFGKSNAQDIEKAFGQHYKYDSKNSFHYYSNSDNDINSTNLDNYVTLNCLGESNILSTYGFFYVNKTGSDNIKITKSPEKYSVPSNYKLTRDSVNKTYRSDEFIVETLEYWKFNNDYNKITQYLENKELNASMGKLVSNKKYGEIFVLESNTYHYEDRYSYYVLIDDGKYFFQVASLAKNNEDARIGYEKAINVALQFIK